MLIVSQRCPYNTPSRLAMLEHVLTRPTYTIKADIRDSRRLSIQVRPSSWRGAAAWGQHCAIGLCRQRGGGELVAAVERLGGMLQHATTKRSTRRLTTILCGQAGSKTRLLYDSRRGNEWPVMDGKNLGGHHLRPPKFLPSIIGKILPPLKN